MLFRTLVYTIVCCSFIVFNDIFVRCAPVPPDSTLLNMIDRCTNNAHHVEAKKLDAFN